MICLTSKLLRQLSAAYTTHRSNSVTRNTPFLMTFGEWLKVWMESGHLQERGRQRGQYYMALALSGRKLSPEHCAKISASNKAAWPGRRLAYRLEARL
jgi:hypothetical protein